MLKKSIHIIKKILGESLFFQLTLLKLNYLHKKALYRIRKKEKINVVFLLIHAPVWKYEKLYRLLEKDNRFNPLVLVCPYMSYGSDNMKNDMEQAYNLFREKNYNVIKSLKEDGSWVQLEELSPDIIFFTSPHFLTKPHYYIFYCKNYLTCYVPYNFGNSHLLQMFHNQDFHNRVWKLFAETKIHKKYSVNVARNKGKNVLVTGFPGTDVFLEKQKGESNIWKHQHTKKIIWAPHHTIDEDKSFISFSSFNLYSEYMFELLDQYNNSIEIVFKPHPLLKIKLYNEPNWGKEKTDAYFNRWKEHPNGNLHLEDYTDLFLSSDAMIHDSGSFLIEYLYTEKPVLRTDRDNTIIDRLNSFGRMAYNVHYIAKNREDINSFIKMIVEQSEDEKKEVRFEFKQKHLLPPNNRTASENIYEYLKSVLK